MVGGRRRLREGWRSGSCTRSRITAQPTVARPIRCRVRRATHDGTITQRPGPLCHVLPRPDRGSLSGSSSEARRCSASGESGGVGVGGRQCDTPPDNKRHAAEARKVPRYESLNRRSLLHNDALFFLDKLYMNGTRGKMISRVGRHT